MAEDGEINKKKQKENVTAIGNSWIICRSHSHSGRIYYFNTLTGKSAWNLSDGEIEKAQLLSREAASGTHLGDCPEPSEPPMDTPNCSSYQNVQPKDTGSRIYNKQIINNQFSKPTLPLHLGSPAIPAFQNSHCPCSFLNSVNDTTINATPVYNPAMWVLPPPHQVLLASAAAVLANQGQPTFNNPNIPIQNTYQSENQNSPNFQGCCNTHFNKYSARFNHNSQRNFQSHSTSDLRDILSAKRKDKKSNRDENEEKEAYERHQNSLPSECEKPKITTDDLDPSDIDDEWLELNTDSDIPCAWRECSGADCWIVVASTLVMLNNRKILSKFIKPDEKIYLLTPLEILKQLRSATGNTASGFRCVQRARCALRFAAQQMDKVPTELKKLQNLSIEKCCLELIKQNYHVLLLDVSELSSEINIKGVSTFTINKLKQYLSQKVHTRRPLIYENITMTICQKSGENVKTINESTQEAPTSPCTNKNELNSIEHKEIEVQTEQTTSVKKTVDACIQTDFGVSLSAQNLQSPISENLKSPIAAQALNTEIIKSPFIDVSSKIEQTLKMDMVVKSSHDNMEESEERTKKIKLNRRTLNVTTGNNPVKKTQFRWRKQRAQPSMTTRPSLKDCVVSNDQICSSKSPPSSLISITDLLPPQNDNFSDLAKSIAFSDAISEKTPEIGSKVVYESSVDEISNSIDETCPEISKAAILEESKDNKKQDIVMFEVTSDLMDDSLSRGCDEWVSRFVQIMEEALSQILQQEPCFFDSAIPPPWSVYEAIQCIKRKFKDNSKIVFACNECGTFLLKISDSRGKIFADLNPSDFMRLYSYGVYLIEALQSLLNDNEDLQIAKETLAKLLDDIKNPNLGVAQTVFMDTISTEKQDNTANVAELDTVTGDDLVDAGSISPPKKKLRQTPCEPSPLRYNLRSGHRSNQMKENDLSEDVGDQSINTAESFLSSLRLQKASSSTGNCVPAETRPLSPQHTCISDPILTGGIKDDTQEKETIGPKIIRNFNFDPDIEKKLKTSKPVKSSNESNADFEYDADDNKYYGNEYINENNYYNNSNTYESSDLNIDNESENQYCTESDEIGTQILKFVRERTTYPLHRVLEDLHSFCEETCRELTSQKIMDTLYKKKLMEKTTEVRDRLNNLCDHLNSIVCRKDTKTRFPRMFEELGFMSFKISDTQVSEYENFFRKYLDQATILFESVNLILTAVAEKK